MITMKWPIMMMNLQVASSLPVAMASPLGWNFTLFMSDVWPYNRDNHFNQVGHHYEEYDDHEEDKDDEVDNPSFM